MREKFLKRREQLLQKIADFIYIMLKATMHDQRQFDYWMWRALSLDYWCVERGIYLN